MASGTTIPNLWEKCFVAVADEGQRRKMRTQVRAVNKVSLLVSRMVQVGNRVIFEQGGTYVEGLHSGEKMYMYEKAECTCSECGSRRFFRGGSTSSKGRSKGEGRKADASSRKSDGSSRGKLCHSGSGGSRRNK